MASSFDPGALLGSSYPLEGGYRVHLRMARSSDVASIRELLHRRGLDPQDLQARRLVQFDPRRRYVLCATELVGSTETLVGVGAIALEPDRAPVPDMLVVDEERGAQLCELLHGALVGRADTLARARAA